MDKATFLSKYGKNHIVVYLGYTAQIRSNPKPPKAGTPMARVDASRVYIDDMNYGSVDRPFSAFEVDPGTHKFEVDAKFGKKQGGIEPMPVRVKDDSVMISLKVIECLSGVYWEVKQFTDIDEFLAYVGERL